MKNRNLIITPRKNIALSILEYSGRILLLAMASLSVLAVLFILFFIAKDAFPFFTNSRRALEFFTSIRWYPSNAEPEFGALAIFIGSGLVTLGAVVIAVPLGITVAIALSDIVPFPIRQTIKPVIEILTAIPSVAYGFFALVVMAPMLQQNGGMLLSVTVPLVFAPPIFLLLILLGDLASSRATARLRGAVSGAVFATGISLAAILLWLVSAHLRNLVIPSGTNALNVSIILGIMALPTVISVSEDALQAVGRELREASYALGATRAETIFRTVIPAAASGIFTAVILGLMRAVGETMVVWMASGNSAQIPEPWYNCLMAVRTLTATIAGDMGEADHVTGSARYHVLFAMAFCLLVFSLALNLLSEWAMARQRAKLGKA